MQFTYTGMIITFIRIQVVKALPVSGELRKRLRRGEDDSGAAILGK